MNDKQSGAKSTKEITINEIPDRWIFQSLHFIEAGLGQIIVVSTCYRKTSSNYKTTKSVCHKLTRKKSFKTRQRDFDQQEQKYWKIMGTEYCFHCDDLTIMVVGVVKVIEYCTSFFDQLFSSSFWCWLFIACQWI